MFLLSKNTANSDWLCSEIR